MGFRKKILAFLHSRRRKREKSAQPQAPRRGARLVASASSQYFHQHGSTPSSRITLPSGVVVPADFSYDHPKKVYQVAALQPASDWRKYAEINDYDDDNNSDEEVTDADDCLRTVSTRPLPDLPGSNDPSRPQRRGIRILTGITQRRIRGIRFMGPPWVDPRVNEESR